MRNVLCLAVCFASSIFAQSATVQPLIGGEGYSSPVPLTVAPGQLITLYVPATDSRLTEPVHASGLPLPPSLAGVSVIFRQGMDQPAPILEVRPIPTCSFVPPPGGTCGTMLAVTAQIPFGILTICPLCGRPDIPAYLAVAVNSVQGPFVSVQPLDNQVHILTSCDVLVSGSAFHAGTSGLPCQPVVTHPDGKQVSGANPAQSGEELVAYAVGLGQTILPQKTGEASMSSAPTSTLFAVDFNYRPNALATKPAGPSLTDIPPPYARPVSTSAVLGFVGLYQINFIVPPPPDGLPACIKTTTPPQFGNAVQSNLTVSVGSVFSFDGAGICVQPGT